MRSLDQPGKDYAHRLLEVAVRRLSEHEGDPTLINQLRWAAAIETAASHDLAHRIRRARERPTLTWQQIGDAIGVSAQAAHQRFRSRSAAGLRVQPGMEIAVDRRIQSSLDSSSTAVPEEHGQTSRS